MLIKKKLQSMGNEKKHNSNYTETIWVMKAIAIFSVLTAHINVVNNDNAISSIVTGWYNLFGIVGVVTFFIVGGYLYKGEQANQRKYWHKKIVNIVIPWVIAGTISYIFHVVKANDLSLFGYLKWVLGSGTIYYFLTNYLLFIYIFKYIYKSERLLFTCVLLTFIQSVLNTFKIYLSYGVITWYLNIFNWIGFFALGIIIKKYNIFDYLLSCKNMLIYLLITSFAVFIFMYLNNISGYFNIISLIYELINVTLVFIISNKLANNKLLIHIGKISFCIYLYHIQIVQNICWKLQTNIITIMINPILGLIIMVLFIYIGQLILNKVKFKEQIYTLVGLR